ncbi:MAG: nickel-dependent hydrogenase large subunit [Candidatus Thorarchaeota archaeon]
MKIPLSKPFTKVGGPSELLIRHPARGELNLTYRMKPFRDFVQILLGQRIADLPRLVARICGTCPVSHRIAAVKAIEMASSISVPPLAETLRELAILGEIIRSHAYSVFFCTSPDLLSLTETLSRQDTLGKGRIQQRLLSQGMNLYRSAQEMIDIIAGDANLAPAIALGGFLRNITDEEQKEMRSSLQLGLAGIKWAKDFYKSILNEIQDDILSFYLESPLFVSCFDTRGHRFSGTDEVSIIQSDSLVCAFSSSVYPTHLKIQGKSEAPTRIIYSCKEEPSSPLLTGPHARLAAIQNLSGQKEGIVRDGPNVFNAGLLRLDEMEFCTLRALHLLDNIWKPDEDTVATWDPIDGIGGGCVENSRGTLLYRLEVSSSGLVNDIDICTPTELNAAAMVHLLTKATRECSELGWSDDRIINYAKMIIRCFDPCVSCATHSQTKTRHSQK